MSVVARQTKSVYYPETDHMGEHALQRFIAKVLRPIIAMWLAMCGRHWFVGADQFFYLIEGNNKRRVAPDIYVLPGVDRTLFPVLKARETQAGSLVCAQTGFAEIPQRLQRRSPAARAWERGNLSIFDPNATARSHTRVRWQVYRVVGARGWRLVERSNEDRFCSRELGCWRRARGTGPGLRVRLATGVRGDTLVPTEGEVA
jgi:hypothetical protein